MRTTTPFDPKRHHINLEAEVNSGEGLPWSIDALLDNDETFCICNNGKA